MIRGMHLSSKAVLSLFVILLPFVSAAPLSAGESAAVWSRIYQRAESYADKLDVMTNIVGFRDRGMIPLLEQALDELVLASGNQRSVQDRARYVELTKLVVKELGNMKVEGAAARIFDVVSIVEDPLLKGEAIVALGKVGAAEYAGEIAEILKNINFNYDTGRDRRYGEIVAFACVVALERFSDPVGYLPLLFASMGWYSGMSEVKSRAERAMGAILADPTEILRDLVVNDSSFVVKLQALKAEDRSGAPAANKLDTAVAALGEGLRRSPRNAAEEIQLGQLRIQALEMIRREAMPLDRAVLLVEQVLYLNYQIDETLTAIQTLKALPGDASVQALIRFLEYQNDRYKEKIVPSDYREVNATIAALGERGSEAAKEELLMVRYTGWPNSVIRESEAALEKLE